MLLMCADTYTCVYVYVCVHVHNVRVHVYFLTYVAFCFARPLTRTQKAWHIQRLRANTKVADLAGDIDSTTPMEVIQTDFLILL